MRKLATKKDKERKRKKQQVALGLVLVLIMVMSAFVMVVGSFSPEGNKKVKYNGLEFYPDNNYWLTDIGELTFKFRYNPKETENVSNYILNQVPLATDYLSKPLYLSSSNQEVLAEIYSNTKYFVERFQNACLNESNCPEDLPIKNCTENFIIIKEAEEPSLTIEENCVFIQGSQQDIVMLTDEFLYKLLGIKQ